MKLNRDEAYWVLNGLPAIGPISTNRLLARFDHDPTRIFEANRDELKSVDGIQKKAIDVILEWENRFDLLKEMRQADKMGVRFISRESSDYPRSLKEIADPPIGLYCLGDYNFSKPSIAMVGSRRTSNYGRAVANSFAKELADRGFCVTSGMARGIDAFAHRGALGAEGGSTVAVLGCGLDIVYPPDNIDIYKAVQTNGAVVSEFPFGRRADRQTFPMRNRLVSGMSLAVVVVESDMAGGSMITARFAGEQGRIVFAVPGRIDHATSKGCNQLIRDGAILLNSVDDLLEEIQYEQQSVPLARTVPTESVDMPDLSQEEKRLMDCLAGGEFDTVDGLAIKLNSSVSDITMQLMMLELKSLVTKRLDGCYEASVVLRSD